MSDSGWGPEVQKGLVSVVLGLVLYWVGSSRQKSEKTEGGAYIMKMGKRYSVPLYFCVAFFVVAAVLCVQSENGGWPTAFVCIGFACLGGIPALIAGLTRHEITSEGIRYKEWFQVQFVPWEQLRTAEYGLKCLLLETKSLGDLKFSAGLNGWDVLAKALLENAPSLIVKGDETRKLLEDARAGNPPNIWE